MNLSQDDIERLEKAGASHREITRIESFQHVLLKENDQQAMALNRMKQLEQSIFEKQLYFESMGGGGAYASHTVMLKEMARDILRLNNLAKKYDYPTLYPDRESSE